MKKNLEYKIVITARIVTIAAGIVAFAHYIPQIWNQMTRPSDSLEMKLHVGVNRIPPILTTEFDNLYDFLKPEKFVSEIELTKILGESPSEDDTLLAEILFRHIAYRLQNQVREAGTRTRSFYKLSDCWRAEVINNGTTRLTDVVAFLPGTTYVSIEREGEEAVFRESSDKIEIGTLRQGEVVSVCAWTSPKISIQDAPKAHINHDRDIGYKTIYEFVGRVGQVADQYWLNVMGFLLWMIGIIVLSRLHHRSENTSNRDDIPAES